jgi:hypothetical protein
VVIEEVSEHCSGMLRLVVLQYSDVSEELTAG